MIVPTLNHSPIVRISTDAINCTSAIVYLHADEERSQIFLKTQNSILPLGFTCGAFDGWGYVRLFSNENVKMLMASI
ncbi:MAG: hypothetical protein ACHBN1_38160 [Heteroscytonema crispum UTEX LB 1556]